MVKKKSIRKVKYNGRKPSKKNKISKVKKLMKLAKSGWKKSAKKKKRR